MLERNRILKSEEKMNNFRIAGMYSLNEEEMYKKEVLDIVTKLFNENPNCFDKETIDYKISLSDKLVKKHNQDINNYYHYTFKDSKHIVGVRYKRITDDMVTLVSGYLRGKVILQVVKYEMDKEYFSELKSLVTYDRFTNEVKIINIAFSETMNDEKNIYYWSNNNQNTDDNKIIVKRFNN